MYLFPWIWLPLVLILVREWRRWARIESAEVRLWLCVAAVPLAVFTLVACFRSVLPHWGLIGLVSMLPILGCDADALLVQDRRWRRRWAAAVGFCLLFAILTVVESRTGWLQGGGASPVKLLGAGMDPTEEFHGWDQIASQVQRLDAMETPGTFLFTSSWYHSGHIDHALRGRAPVLCYNSDDARGFAYWSRPEDWVGRDAILISIGDKPREPGFFQPWFQRIEPLTVFEVERGGIPIRKVRLFHCVNQITPFPFDPRDLGDDRQARDRAIQARREFLRNAEAPPSVRRDGMPRRAED